MANATQTEAPARIILPMHRMSWEHINNPEVKVNTRTKKEDTIYRYQAWIPGDTDPKELAKMKALFEATRDAQWSKGVPPHKAEGFIMPYKRATAKDYHVSPQLLEMKEAAGGLDPIIVNLKSYNRAPGLRKLAPGNQRVAVEDGDIYSGCWCVAAVTTYAYDTQSVGVSFSLQNILKVKDDTSLGGGGVSADVEFEGITQETYGITNEDLLGNGDSNFMDDI